MQIGLYYFSSSKVFTTNKFISLKKVYLRDFLLKDNDPFLKEYRLFKKAKSSYKNNRFSKETIISMQRIMQGKPCYWRSKAMVVGNTDIQYRAPNHRDLEALMGSYVSDFKKNSTTEYNIYLYAKFLAIHPFSDGNGRMARLLFLLNTGSANEIFSCPYLYHSLKLRYTFDNLIKIALNSNYSSFIDSAQFLKFWRKYEEVELYLTTAVNNLIEKLCQIFQNVNLDCEKEFLKELVLKDFLDVNYVSDKFGVQIEETLKFLIEQKEVSIIRKDDVIYISSKICDRLYSKFDKIYRGL